MEFINNTFRKNMPFFLSLACSDNSLAFLIAARSMLACLVSFSSSSKFSHLSIGLPKFKRILTDIFGSFQVHRTSFWLFHVPLPLRFLFYWTQLLPLNEIQIYHIECMYYTWSILLIVSDRMQTPQTHIFYLKHKLQRVQRLFYGPSFHVQLFVQVCPLPYFPLSSHFRKFGSHCHHLKNTEAQPKHKQNC